MGLFSSVGSFLNSVTGVTSSSAQAQKYAVANAAQNNAYQKEFMQNAHQWEMQDLKNAGLNPALTATGGSGATASGGGSFAGNQGVSSGNPLDIINSIVGMKNATNATKSQIELNKAKEKAVLMNARTNAENAQTNRYKSRGSKEGIIGEIATKGAKSTLKELKNWLSR